MDQNDKSMKFFRNRTERQNNLTLIKYSMKLTDEKSLESRSLNEKTIKIFEKEVIFLFYTNDL